MTQPVGGVTLRNQVYPLVFCPQPSRLQLFHLVAHVITADVECSRLNPPSTLCPPNSLGQEGNPLPSPPARSHSGIARTLVPSAVGGCKNSARFQLEPQGWRGSVSPPGGITRHMLPGAFGWERQAQLQAGERRPRRWKPDQRRAQTV